MPKGCFNLLSEKVCMAVGDKEFMSESYLANLSGHKRNMFEAYKKTSGGYLSGEVKLAVMLCLMVSGSYLDISMIYVFGYTHTYKTLLTVIDKWICNPAVIDFLGDDYVTNKEEMKKVASQFKNGGSHCSILAGVLGTLDRWLVRIRSPTVLKDGIKEPGRFFTWKGLFAINVQAIVD